MTPEIIDSIGETIATIVIVSIWAVLIYKLFKM